MAELTKEKTIKAFLPFILLSIISLIIVLGYFIIEDIIIPPKIINYGATIIYGYAVPNIILFIGTFSIFAAWMIHGFGFFIIKR